MALYQCKACGAAYVDPQKDGSRYFHACAPVYNEVTQALVERADKRDENVETKPDGKTLPKNDGKGRDTLPGVKETTLVKQLLLLIAFLGLFALPVHAQSVYNVCSTFSGTDVTITTTAETVVATSEACRMPGRPVKLIVRVYGVVTTSADSATYKVRVRRDSVAGAVLGDAIAQTILVTAGGTEPFMFTATDERVGTLNSVTYVATLEIASASATSTVGQAYIEVMILG